MSNLTEFFDFNDHRNKLNEAKIDKSQFSSDLEKYVFKVIDDLEEIKVIKGIKMNGISKLRNDSVVINFIASRVDTLNFSESNILKTHKIQELYFENKEFFLEFEIPENMR